MLIVLWYIVLVLAGVLSAAISYCVWTFIHEMSHALVGKLFLGAYNFKFHWIPVRNKEGGWTVASVDMYIDADIETPIRLGFMSIAPAIVDTLACIALPFTFNYISMSFVWFAVNILIFGGVVDILANAYRTTTTSDAQSAAKEFGIPYWSLRVASCVIAGLSIIACFIL